MLFLKLSQGFSHFLRYPVIYSVAFLARGHKQVLLPSFRYFYLKVDEFASLPIVFSIPISSNLFPTILLPYKILPFFVFDRSILPSSLPLLSTPPFFSHRPFLNSYPFLPSPLPSLLSSTYLICIRSLTSQGGRSPPSPTAPRKRGGRRTKKYKINC